MATYSRSATCTKGHVITVSFEWDANRATDGPKEYSESCPVPGCGGTVSGRLPIGTDSASVKLEP